MNVKLNWLLLMIVIALTGCASALNELKSVTARLEQARADEMAMALQGFPDTQMRSAFVRDDGRPAESLRCPACRLESRRVSDLFDFLLIDRDAEPVNDVAELAARNAAQPIETSDVGRVFIRTASARGNDVAIFGPAVNRAILRTVPVGVTRLEHRRHFQDLSSALVEIDGHGVFVAVLAVEHSLQQSTIQSDFPGSRDVNVDEWYFVFPETTARYLQERLPREFTESYRLR